MIRVLLVDDTRLHRDAVLVAVSQAADVTAVGAVGSDPASISAALQASPDVILLSVAVPQRLATLRSVAAAAPNAKVIALGLAEEEREVVACIEMGAAGYMLCDGSAADLVDLVHCVARGETVCSPRVVAALVRRVADLAPARQRWSAQSRLTPREREILRLVDEGLSNKEIARRLSVEVRTVKTHVHNLLEKLQVHRRGEAAALMRETQQTILGQSPGLRL